MKKLQIAILGSGNVGSALAKGWSAAGHAVTFGTRDPDGGRASEASRSADASVAGTADAVKDADVIVLAVPWSAVEDTLATCGDLAGRVLLDCTNPLLPDLAGLEVGLTTSGAEQVAAHARGARVVKVFNTTGAGNMLAARYGDHGLTMLYAGNDEEAKELAAQLAADLGFEPQDAGPLSSARLLEPFAMLWITLAYKGGLGTDFGFRLVRRKS